MGKRVRKSKKILKQQKITIINIFILSISLCLILLFTFLSYQKINDLKKNYTHEIKDIKKILSQEKEKLKKVEEELSYYQNPDEAIVKTKEEYFGLLKKLENSILHEDDERKIAYLTFDDGPYYNTYRVFDILDQYQVKATFFTTNTNGEYCFDNKSENCWIRYKEYLTRGHTIANHTYTHAIFRGLYNSVDSFMNDVIMQEDLVREQTGGYVTNIVRFPGGSVTARGIKDSIVERLRERGYGWVDWNALDGDGGDISSASEAWSIFTNSINEKVEVILYHDYNYTTTSLLPEMIEYLQNNGYILLPLFYDSEMIQK